MDIFEYLIDEVEKGEHFHIDLRKRNMTVGNKVLIKDGVCKGDMKSELHEDFLDEVKRLYSEYRVSDPSKQSERRHRTFYALPAKEMTWEQMTVGIPRELARARLEGYILHEIMSGKTWDEVIRPCTNKAKLTYFWRDGDIVLFREWFEIKEV